MYKLCTEPHIFIAASFILFAPSGKTMAATIDGVSFLPVQHGFTVKGDTVPVGITSRTFGSSVSVDRETLIHADDAVLAADTSDVTVRYASCASPTPSTHIGQHRINRADPTEFADAQFDNGSGSVQDGGSDGTFFAIGERDLTQSGLARARVTSSPAPATALSGCSMARTTIFENITGTETVFLIGGYFDAFLLSRCKGGDGLARTTTSVNILFSNADPVSFNYATVVPVAESLPEIGDGASVTAGLFTTVDGIEGLKFTANATAMSGSGMAEASVSAEHEFLAPLRLAQGWPI